MALLRGQSSNLQCKSTRFYYANFVSQTEYIQDVSGARTVGGKVTF